MLRLDRRFIRFLARVGVLWALGLLPWPGLGPAFTRGFDAAANTLAGAVRPRIAPLDALAVLQLGIPPSFEEVELALDFQSVAESGVEVNKVAPAGLYAIPDPSWYTVFRVRNTATGAATRIAICVRTFVYVPLVVFLALTFGAPMAPRRPDWVRGVALGIALTAMVAACLLLLPILSVLGSTRVQALSVDPLSSPWIKATFSAMCETITAIVVMLWAGARWASIRSGNWLWLDGVVSESTPAEG